MEASEDIMEENQQGPFIFSRESVIRLVICKTDVLSTAIIIN